MLPDPTVLADGSTWQRLLRQYLYFCASKQHFYFSASKASKLSTSAVNAILLDPQVRTNIRTCPVSRARAHTHTHTQCQSVLIRRCEQISAPAQYHARTHTHTHTHSVSVCGNDTRATQRGRIQKNRNKNKTYLCILCKFDAGACARKCYLLRILYTALSYVHTRQHKSIDSVVSSTSALYSRSLGCLRMPY